MSKRIFIRRNKRTGKITGTKVVRANRVRAAGRRRRYNNYMNMRTAGFVGLELKFLDCAWDGVTINATTDGSGIEMQPSSGCTGCISAPAQGDGASQRDGRKITVKSIWVSGVIDTTHIADQPDAREDFGCWVALVMDKQTNAQTINSEDIVINPSTNGAGMLPSPLRNLANSKRFKICDWKYLRPGGMYGVADNAGTTNFTASLAPQTGAAFNLNWRGSEVVDLGLGTTANVTACADISWHVIMCKVGTGTPDFTKVLYGKSRMRFMG